MDKLKKSKFINISSVLPKVVGQLGLDRRLNEQVFLSCWFSIVDPAFITRSKPLFIDSHNHLVVAVQDSSTAQEMSFLKAKLIKKLKQIGQELGLTIDGLRFDLKRFYEIDPRQSSDKTMEISDQISEAKGEHLPGDEELENINLTADELLEINDLQQIMPQIATKLGVKETESFGQKIIALLEKKLRLKRWHKNMKLPLCKDCGGLVFRLDLNQCQYCFQLRLAQPKQ